MVDEFLQALRGTRCTTADLDHVNLVKGRTTVYNAQKTVAFTLIVVDLEYIHMQLIIESVMRRRCYGMSPWCICGGATSVTAEVFRRLDVLRGCSGSPKNLD